MLHSIMLQFAPLSWSEVCKSEGGHVSWNEFSSYLLDDFEIVIQVTCRGDCNLVYLSSIVQVANFGYPPP